MTILNGLMEFLQIYEHKKREKILRSINDENELFAKPADVFNTYMQDPTVHHVLGHWIDGRISWEQALMKCVVVLSEQLQDLRNEKAKWGWQAPEIKVALHNTEED